MQKRNRFFYTLLRPVAVAFVRLWLGYRYEKATNLPDKYLVLSNHATDYDPILVGAAFRKPMFFVGSEHIARWKLAYTLLNFMFHPIMRYKGAPATSAVMEVVRRMNRYDANVCIFAEGVRTWDGVTCPILPSTAKLVKKLRCGLVTFRLTGGYFASPMWAGASARRGPCRGAPVRVYTAEELAAMSEQEIDAAIRADLYENAYERQLADPKPYKGKRPAEGLENLLFLCPECGGRDSFSSKKDTVACKSCGFSFRYDTYGMLQGAPFKTLLEFSDWQKEQIAADIAAGIPYTAENAVLKTIAKHIESPLAEGPLTMSAERLTCGDFELPLSEITDFAMHGQRAIVFSAGKQYYELIPAEGFNALKFQLYHNGCLQWAAERVDR